MRLRLRVILLIVELLIINYSLIIETEATVRYVSKTGRSTPPYTSWATAADSIQKCINICEYGDTIYVANGVYKEYLRIYQKLTLIGLSMDSTVIDGTGLSDTTIFATGYLTLNSFTIKGIGYGVGFVIFPKNNLSIESCIINQSKYGILAVGGNFYFINENFFNQLQVALCLTASPANANYYVVNNVILLNQPLDYKGIWLDFGGYYYVISNIILTDKNVRYGIAASWPKRFYIKNNLISGFYNNIYIDIVTDTSYIINNVLTHSLTSAASIYPSRVRVYNSILKNNSKYGTYTLPATRVDYNIFYQNYRNFYYAPQQGDSNLVNIDPMLVNDIKPSVTNNWDYHLQAYSPAIDKGDPSILDPDGSRSDIGMYGGPYGKVYTYQDLAPRPPRNLSAVVDSGRVRLKWNKNTEADTSHYRIYRSLTPNFIIDTTKLIGTTKDTNYVDILSQSYQKLYYKLTCVDKQGNQSGPSEELMVNLVSINEYPTVVSDYYLYQNYPNPFSVREGNSTTKIGYKLKERGYVKLMVYDIKGERVAVLVNEEKEAGYYEVEFDANVYQLDSRQTGINNPIASGIYLYRIEVIGEGNIPVYTEMRKMVLVK